MGGEGVFLALPLHDLGGLAGDAGAGRPEGMTQGNGAAVDVGFCQVQTEVVDDSKGLCRKRFVEFDDINVAQFQSGPLERFVGGVDRTNAHDLGRATGHRDGFDPGQWREAMFFRIGFAGDKYG